MLKFNYVVMYLTECYWLVMKGTVVVQIEDYKCLENTNVKKKEAVYHFC